MIRPLTFLSLVAAAGAGLHLYGVKHEVSQLERVLRDTVRQTDAARERTAVLRAEWALLNEPERLRAAAAKSLPLEVMQTAQFVRPADLDRRLPAAVAFAGAPSLFAPAPGERPGGASNVAVAAAIPVVAPIPPAPPQQVAAVAARPLPSAPPRPAPVAERPAPERSAPAERPIERSVERPAAIAAAAPRLALPPVPDRAPAIERPVVAERPMRVPPPHLPQTASLRAPEPREAAPRDPVRDLPARVRAAEPRMTEREVDRGINLAQPPQAPAFLRTAMQVRPAAPPAAAAPAAAPAAVPQRAPELPAAAGSLLGGTSRPLLAPPVPVARANAGTLDSAR